MNKINGILWGFLVVFCVNFVAPSKVYAVQTSASFIPADYMSNASPNWFNPIRALGLPDARTATISAVGLPTLIGYFEEQAPTEYTTLTAIKFDIVGANADNLTIFPTHNDSNICSGKTVSLGSTLAHNYIIFTVAECSGLSASYFSDHTAGFRFSYYYGNQNVSATIDSVMVMPIFNDSPYTTGVVNDAPIYAAPTSITPIGNDQYNSITNLMQQRIPWAYIYALSTMNYGTAATTSAVPDVAFNYTSKYNGNQVFSYDFLVRGTDLPDLNGIRLTLRTMISVVLWFGVIWYFSKHWRYLFQGH